MTEADKPKFVAGLAILAGAFGRMVDAPVQKAYWRVLAPKLSIEEFEHAVGQAIEKETYWPSPAVLLEVVRPKDEAQRALSGVVGWLRDCGGHLHAPHEDFQKLPAETRAGIAAVGGLRAISLAHVEDMPRIERLFSQGFTGARYPALREGGQDRALPPRDRHPSPAEARRQLEVGQTIRATVEENKIRRRFGLDDKPVPKMPANGHDPSKAGSIAETILEEVKPS